MEREELQQEPLTENAADIQTPQATESEEIGDRPQQKTTPLEDLHSLLHDLVYILATITIVFVFFFRIVGVSGDSMLPTLVNRDYLILQSNPIMGNLEYGDVVVARELTFQEGEPIVKRVIATEGQSVLIQMDVDGFAHVYVDGMKLDEPYILEPMYPYYFEQDDDGDPNQFSTVVSPGHVFVMGDNRNNSSDSRVRSIGEIKVDQVLGKVVMILFPGQDNDTESRDWSRIGGLS